MNNSLTKNAIISVLKSKTREKEYLEMEDGDIKKTRIIMFENSEYRHYESFIENISDEILIKINRQFLDSYTERRKLNSKK